MEIWYLFILGLIILGSFIGSTLSRWVIMWFHNKKQKKELVYKEEVKRNPIGFCKNYE